MPPKGRRGTTVPTPAKLKLIEGRGNGRDSGGREVKPPPGFIRYAPEMPEEVEWDSTAKDEWIRVVSELTRLQLIKPLDGPSLAAYCLAWSRFITAQAMIRTQGFLAETSQGMGVAPWLRVAESSAKQLLAFAQEFGLTPSAEARLNAGGDDDGEDNPYA